MEDSWILLVSLVQSADDGVAEAEKEKCNFRQIWYREKPVWVAASDMVDLSAPATAEPHLVVVLSLKVRCIVESETGSTNSISVNLIAWERASEFFTHVWFVHILCGLFEKIG